MPASSKSKSKSGFNPFVVIMLVLIFGFIRSAVINLIALNV